MTGLLILITLSIATYLAHETIAAGRMLIETITAEDDEI